MPAGRPSELTDSIRTTIVDMLAVGDSVGKISKTISKGASQIFRWIDADTELSDLYARAKQAKAQLLAEEILEISDDNELKPDDKRIRVDARKWVAGKYYGKLFGDRTTIDATINDYSNMTPDDRKRRLLELQQELLNAERG